MSAGGRIANISAALLLGGASERMGCDKGSIALRGASAAEALAALLAASFEDVMLVGGEPPKSALGRRVADPPGERCALRGLVAALEAAREERVLVVATDLLGLTPTLLLALVAQPDADAVVPRTSDGEHPLCALYKRDAALPLARARLARGELSLRGVLSELRVHWLEGEDLSLVDPGGRALVNVNTPEDLARFQAAAVSAPPLRAIS